MRVPPRLRRTRCGPERKKQRTTGVAGCTMAGFGLGGALGPGMQIEQNVAGLSAAVFFIWNV